MVSSLQCRLTVFKEHYKFKFPMTSGTMLSCSSAFSCFSQKHRGIVKTWTTCYQSNSNGKFTYQNYVLINCPCQLLNDDQSMMILPDMDFS